MRGKDNDSNVTFKVITCSVGFSGCWAECEYYIQLMVKKDSIISLEEVHFANVMGAIKYLL